MLLVHSQLRNLSYSVLIFVLSTSLKKYLTLSHSWMYFFDCASIDSKKRNLCANIGDVSMTSVRYLLSMPWMNVKVISQLITQFYNALWMTNFKYCICCLGGFTVRYELRSAFCLCFICYLHYICNFYFFLIAACKHYYIAAVSRWKRTKCRVWLVPWLGFRYCTNHSKFKFYNTVALRIVQYRCVTVI